MSGIVVLMYHALYDGAAALDRIEPADRPYAVAVQDFARQLDQLLRSGVPVISLQRALASPERLPEHAVMLTFDDGHASWCWHALPLLRERALSATFFVTSDLVGTRQDFCTWAQLRELVAGGMAVQAHGQTHRFFDDLTEHEARREFEQAKGAIETGTGAPVRAISFPGGRYRERNLVLGSSCGYRLFFTSDVGANSPARFTSRKAIRRMAVKRETVPAAFQRMISAESGFLWRMRAVAGAKHALRRIVGNRLYQGLYERLSS